MKKNNRLLALTLSAAMVMSLSACGGSSGSSGSQAAETQAATAAETAAEEAAPAGEEAEADPYADLNSIEILCVSAMEPGTASIEAAEYMKSRLDEETSGKITMTILPSGQTGGEAEQAEALMVGEADMIVTGTLPIVTYTPEYGFFDCPFVFEGSEHMLRVWNGAIGDGCREKLESLGFHALGMMGRGYRHISSNKAINSIDDMQGLVIRTPQGATFVDTFAALGCVPVPIALTELFTALQTGVCEASEGPWDQLVTNKLYEVQDYIIESQYYYATSTFFMNSDFYAGLPEAYQNLIDEVSAETMEYGTNLSKEMEEPLKQQCIDAGVEILQMGDMTPYLEATKDVVAKFFEETWTVTTPEEIASYQ
ncbi:MAG: TRAP transporter substrate-binding protein [Clostridiales bacterium]|nr:TRAP transporter substrate-binding protein [Clostridiales bacterium]